MCLRAIVQINVEALKRGTSENWIPGRSFQALVAMHHLVASTFSRVKTSFHKSNLPTPLSLPGWAWGSLAAWQNFYLAGFFPRFVPAGPPVTAWFT